MWLSLISWHQVIRFCPKQQEIKREHARVPVTVGTGIFWCFPLHQSRGISQSWLNSEDLGLILWADVLRLNWAANYNDWSVTNANQSLASSIFTLPYRHNLWQSRWSKSTNTCLGPWATWKAHKQKFQTPRSGNVKRVLPIQTQFKSLQDIDTWGWNSAVITVLTVSRKRFGGAG